MSTRLCPKCVLSSVCVLVLLGSGEPAAAKPIAQSSPPAATCARVAEPAGFADPQTAYERYAASINGQRWCDAISSFTPESRPNLVVSTFKGFLLMAGLESTKRTEFLASLEAFCAKHGFDYSRPERLATLTASILNKVAVESELTAFTRTANESPENMYAELMSRVASVNGSAMVQFEPALNDLTVTGETAKAVARAQDGRRVPVPFSKTSGGWLLTEP